MMINKQNLAIGIVLVSQVLPSMHVHSARAASKPGGTSGHLTLKTEVAQMAQ